MFSEVMRYILDLGPTVMLPIVIIIFSKILGMKAGDCFKAGLHIGIGFVGIGLVIGLMLDSIGPAAKAMAENFDLNLHVVDVGWPGSSPMTWASQIALVAIPIAILVNVAMLLTRMTRVVNVDYSAAIFLIPICISFDTAEKRRYATYLILNRRFSFEF